MRWRARVLLALCAVLLAACGTTAQHGPKTTTTSGPPTPVPSLGTKYATVLGKVPFTFLQFSKLIDKDHHPDGTLIYEQAAPVRSALQNLDTALAGGSAPRRIAHDMATLVLADEELLSDLEQLPGLNGSRLATWEEGFSKDGDVEQTAYNDVLYDFDLPSVGTAAGSS